MRFAVLLIFFSVISLVELAVLIEVSRYIGTWGTIVLVIGTALVGTSILKRQGLHTLARINCSLAQGITPVQPVAEGFLLIIAGVFLLTPGIITDLIGFSLFIPSFRRSIVQLIFNRLLTLGTVFVNESVNTQFRNQNRQEKHGEIFDAEYELVDKKKSQPTD
ncbi:MAG: FxsA family protein [Hyphomicrobiaceae bacterium]|nr:FxsA family protein [Hyphomicrobiaceae bacterium]